MMAPQRAGERASVSTFVALMAVFFLGLALLVAAGGQRLSNISRAEDLASEAARAAAASLDVGDLAVGVTAIDVEDIDGAQVHARRVLEASGDQVDFRVQVAADRRSVRVDVIVHSTSLVPGFDVRGHGTHVARVVEPASYPSP